MNARVRPLHARPGARFACSGDGVCCSDVHGVGPLGARDRGIFRAMHPELVIRVGGTAVLAMGPDGACPFFGAHGCALHARLGPRAKPESCTRFPFGLVATPDGGRITTSHRCSCRSLGPRPELELAAAEDALRASSGRLRADLRIAGPIALSGRSSVAFDAYVARERELLDELASAPSALGWLAKRAPSRRTSRAELRARGRQLASATRTTRFGVAIAWMGHALCQRSGERAQRWPERPWGVAFDRAEARTPAPDSPAAFERSVQASLADYAADALWSLDWCVRGGLDAELARLREQLEAGHVLIDALVAQGARPDRAAAEALMILELASDALE